MTADATTIMFKAGSTKNHMIAMMLSILFRLGNLPANLAAKSKTNNKIVAGNEAIKLKNGKNPCAPLAVESYPSEIKMIAVKTVKMK
ncbi:MAG: hypothetical protein ACPGLU_03140 [Paracoccaceae bacterium]